MQTTPEQLQKQVTELTKRLDELTKANSIPKNVEDAFRARLAFGLSDLMLWGFATMPGTASSSVVITDSRIKTTSVIVVTTTNYINPQVFSAVCSTGFATIYTSAGFDSAAWNYMIIF